jgi:clan AA aspartic protease (TIGR02281 family)
MDRYYRRDPVEHRNSQVNQAVDELNQWSKSSHAVLGTRQQDLNQDYSQIKELETEIQNIDSRLETLRSDPSPDSIQVHNDLVVQKNDLVRQYNDRCQTYNTKGEEYTHQVQEREKEWNHRREKAEKTERTEDDQLQTYRRWVKERGPERFFNDLNRFYASLHQEYRQGGNSAGELEGYIDSARKIRNELGQYARAYHEKIENGFLIVPVTLSHSEQCWMVVDTGATSVTITPELTDVLGLTDQMGEEIEVDLAGGIRIKAPQITLPSLTVQGMEARNVDAVVLKGSQIGVDGCLGFSFLNQFDYRISKEKPQKLIINFIAGSTPLAPFDVFISHKSEDFIYAKKVYDLLVESNHTPFLGKISLEERGSADFQKGIDSALEETTHLVVVCSSKKNVEAPWVESEWRLFTGLKRSGGKRGNIITVMCENMSVEELPIALRHYQALSMNDINWKTALGNYLPKK